MKAIKCDRCGKFEKLDNFYGEKSYEYVLPTKLYNTVVSTGKSIDRYDKDLCIDCIRSLVDWVKRDNTSKNPSR